MMLGGLGDGMRRASSGSTTAFRNSTPSLRPPSAASSGGITAGITFRRCWLQDQERRNAENLSESVGISARAMQRFLTEARWSDETVIGRLQEYLGAPAGAPGGGVGVRWQRLPEAGQEIGGSGPAVLRQAGQGGQLPGWDVPGLRQPAGPGVGGQAAVSAQELDLRPGPVWLRRVCRRTGGTTGQRRSWPWSCWSGPWSWATSGPSGLPETTPSGCRRPSGRDWRPWGCATCWTFRAAPTVWPLEPAWTSPEYPGFGRPRKPKLRPGQRRTMEQRGDELPDEAWAGDNGGPREARGRAATGSVPSGCGPPGGASPARNCGPSGAGTWTAASPATTGPTLPRAQPWRLWPTWVGPGGALKRSSETEKGDVGLDEYETRSWAGWHHHVAMCLLGGAFLLSLQQDWGGKRCPRDHEATGVPGGAGDAAPGAVRARSIAVVAGGYAAAQRTGSPFPRETPLHPPRRQDGAATLNPSL